MFTEAVIYVMIYIEKAETKVRKFFSRVLLLVMFIQISLMFEKLHVRLKLIKIS